MNPNLESTVVAVASLIGLERAIAVIEEERGRITATLSGLLKMPVGHLVGKKRDFRPHGPVVHYQAANNRSLCKAHGANLKLSELRSDITCKWCNKRLERTAESTTPFLDRELQLARDGRQSPKTEQEIRKSVLSLLKKTPASKTAINQEVRSMPIRVKKVLDALVREGVIKKANISVKVKNRTYNGTGYKLAS